MRHINQLFTYFTYLLTVMQNISNRENIQTNYKQQDSHSHKLTMLLVHYETHLVHLAVSNCAT